MSNKILTKIIEDRKGHYCHALEVNFEYELENIVESFIDETNHYKPYPYKKHEEYSVEEFIEFFQTMDIYYLGEDKEEEEKVHNFDFEYYIKDTVY